jgi:hypothetical protein
MQSTSTGSRHSASWLALALLSGVAADLLFRDAGLGLNVLVWVALVELAWLAQRADQQLNTQERLLLGLILCFGAGWVWRAAPMLRLADTIGLFTCAAVLPLVREESLLSLSLHRFFAGVRGLLARLGTGLIPAAWEAQDEVRARGAARVLLPAVRGVVLAVPAVVIFGALFASADADFQSLVDGLVRIDAEWLVTTCLTVMFGSWIAAGLLNRSAGRTARLPSGAGRIGAIEVGIVLGAVDLLFLTFVILQGRYFFGGEALVRQDPGLSFSEYARRGFFELVTVSALVLPLALIIKGRLRPDDTRALTGYRIAAGLLTGLTLVIVASAFHRMAIYQRQFGLTELRFYASAFIGGIAYTLVWFASTVLAGRDRRFLGGALVAWTAWVAMLHLVNPASVIARVNLQRAIEGRQFDAAYVASIGADAVPTLVAGLERLSPSDRDALASKLNWERIAPSEYDWRAWSLAEARARRAARQVSLSTTIP